MLPGLSHAQYMVYFTISANFLIAEDWDEHCYNNQFSNTEIVLTLKT